jgi:hypothetical protein
MVFNATFNNISVISWRSVLLVEETGENHWPAECHWQTLSHNDVLSTPHMSGIRTHNVIGDRHWFGCSEHLFWFTVFTQCTTLLLFLHSKIFGIKDTSTSVPHFAQIYQTYEKTDDVVIYIIHYVILVEYLELYFTIKHLLFTLHSFILHSL